MLRLYSNEIVFAGHPDKVADQISDALLDAYMKEDKYTRAGIEVVGGKNKIFVTGEVTSNADVNVIEVVKSILKKYDYDIDKYEIINNIGKQSQDIAQGVNVGGAGDQGMMFGYACDDTKEYLPTAQVILQKFSKAYEDVIKEAPNVYFHDGKAQITGYYDEEFKLKKIKTFTISYQNYEGQSRGYYDNILKEMAKNICSNYGIEIEEFLINPTGKFFIGGFDGDAGLTGRKIVVDNYHSFANVGGGAFSGKDPSKVDRSGAYKARQIAIRMLKENNLKWCEVQLSYAIGIAEPLAIYISSDKGNIEPTKDLYEECTPEKIIDNLNLRNVKYEDTAKYGHFGGNFNWDRD